MLCAAILVMVAACSSGSRKSDKHPSATTVEGLAAAVKEEASRSDQDVDAKTRVDLAQQASVDADACVKLEPHSAACLFVSAVAMGLEARANPSFDSIAVLTDILQTLSRAESTDPNYDNAGPARVQALVYLRAPGWPLGPGDPQAGLEAARRAVALYPDYPPNRLAMAEAQLKTGDYKGARESFTHARDTAQALPASADRNDWLKQANEALRDK
jgi:hypothetical protein